MEKDVQNAFASIEDRLTKQDKKIKQILEIVQSNQNSINELINTVRGLPA